MTVLSREERFEAIATGDTVTVVAAAGQVLARHGVSVLRPPVAASLMMRAIETAQGTVFNFGEVAVTEAEVELAGERGYCVVIGFEPQKALAGAIIDAACAAGVDDSGELERTLKRLGEARKAALAADWQRLAATRVQFDRLPG